MFSTGLHKIKKSVSIVLLLSFCFTHFNVKAQDIERDQNARIKAIFLYNFTRYFEWPNTTELKLFRFGVLASDSSLIAELRNLAQKKKVGNLDIEVIPLYSATNIPALEVLYIDSKEHPAFQITNVKKHTLVVNYRGSDLYNTMIAFFNDEENKLKFALNNYLVGKSKLIMNPDFKAFSTSVIENNEAYKVNNVEIAKWQDILKKLKSSSQKQEKEVNLSNRELEEVLKNIESQNKAIENAGKIMHQQGNKIEEQTTKIDAQISELNNQKIKINEQLAAIYAQEQKLKGIKSELAKTALQNVIKQEQLDLTVQELQAQQKRMQKQKEILYVQKKDIELQSGKLIKQLEQISTQKTIIWLTFILVGLIIASLAFVYRNFKKTQKINALLETQKREITEQNTIIYAQKHLVEEKQKEITDSINYAQRIQRALLASDKILAENLKNYFVLFQPKDIVSGDFYWSAVLKNGQFILATADSTGHGVPGAIMSMLNISCLEKAIEQGLTQPAEILNFTRKKIIQTLANDGSEEGGKDGMDCSLISFDFKNNLLNFAQANNPIWIIRNKELLEFAPDKMPVGKHSRDSISFSQQSFSIQRGDQIYTLTDGLPDQFGGPKSKKFMYKQLKGLLLTNSNLPLPQQKSLLETAFNTWKGSQEQVDDVTLIGVKV